jgi:splicing factor 3B subunit 3
MRQSDRSCHLARARQYSHHTQSPGTSSSHGTVQPADSLQQALTAPPSSICLAEIFDTSIDKNRPTMFLNIGLSNGVLLRTVVDPVDGSLSDTRLRFLGAKPPKLVRSTIHGSPSVMAFSGRTWLLYTYQDMLQTQPLIYDTLEYAWNLSASMCPDGLIGISGNTLR